MKKINVGEIKPGMILAEEIVSPKGQVLAGPGTPITAQQLLHVSYYGIEQLAVQDEKDAIEKYDFDAPDEFIGETQSWRIVNSEEFQEFKRAYNKCSEKLEAIDGAMMLIRGLRNSADFEYENQLAQINSTLNKNIHTVFFVPSPENACISSSAVRELILNKCNLTGFVPLEIADFLYKKFKY